MAWEIHHRKGIHLPQVGWWLDAQSRVERSFVSHAHSDHIARHREILCSRGTARFLHARLPGKRTEHVLPFGHTEQLTADCAVTLHPAGHICGSAQCLLAHSEHGTLLYTGDFKLRPSLAAEPCVTPRADVLIMETTFGLPRYVMPPTERIHADIVAFCRQALAESITPVLYAYALGKTQELVQLLGQAGLPIMLAPAAHRMTQVYEELGQKMPPYAEFEPARHAGHVVIMPHRSPQLDWIHPRRTAAVTGWAIDSGTKYQYGCDAAFPLSDHADFNDLLAFVELVQPKVVYTLHGFAKEFALTLRQRGVEAWAVGQGNQLELSL